MIFIFFKDIGYVKFSTNKKKRIRVKRILLSYKTDLIILLIS
jgi:hypothetical protein